MEAILATAVMLVLIVGGFVLLGRSWPRSSRIGGWRAGLRGERDAHTEEQARGVQEDDDVRWKWRGPPPAPHR
jgi:hypothetical protein